MYICVVFFFFKQKTAYEMRISDWSSDVCSSDLLLLLISTFFAFSNVALAQEAPPPSGGGMFDWESGDEDKRKSLESWQQTFSMPSACWGCELFSTMARVTLGFGKIGEDIFAGRSEEHTYKLQSQMRISYAVIFLNKKNKQN